MLAKPRKRIKKGNKRFDRDVLFSIQINFGIQYLIAVINVYKKNYEKVFVGLVDL